MKLEHLVHATDFSESSRPAALAAASLARRSGCKTTIVHAYDPVPLGPAVTYPVMLWTGDDFGPMMRREAEVGLQGVLDGTFAGVSNVETHAIDRRGAAHAVANFAHEENASLVVVGTHGRSGLGRMLIGSVAEGMARHVPTDVLIVPSKTEGKFAPKSILVATDFSKAAEKAMARAAELQATYGSKLTLMHVFPIETAPLAEGFAMYRRYEEVAEELQAALRAISGEAFDTPAEVMLETSNSPALALTDYAREHDFDLIVLGGSGRGVLDRVLLGSVAEKAVRHTPCPIWIAR